MPLTLQVTPYGYKDSTLNFLSATMLVRGIAEFSENIGIIKVLLGEIADFDKENSLPGSGVKKTLYIRLFVQTDKGYQLPDNFFLIFLA